MKLCTKNIIFVLNKNNQWHYEDMAKIFNYVKFFKNEKITQKEKELL